MKDKLIAAGVWIALTLGVAGFGIGVHILATPQAHLAGSFSPTGGGTYLLQSSISSTQNTLTLTSFTEPGSGIPYTLSYIGSDIIYGTIAPSSGRSEFVSATGITQNANGTATLTGVTRGESRTPGTGGCVASSTLAVAWPGQTQFILSNTPCFYSEYAALRDAQTISGLWTFTTPPVGINPGGSPNASVTVNGLVQLATARQAASSTGTGSTGAKDVLQSVYATDTPQNCSTPATGGCVVMALLNGKLSQAWYDLTQAFTVNGAWVFNSSATFNGAVSLPSGTTLNGTTISPKFGGTAALGTLSVSSGTTTISLGSASYVELDYSSISITSTGHLAFSSPASGGTFIVLRSTGNTTLTCSPAPCIDISGLGGAGGTAGASGASSGSAGTSGSAFFLFKTSGGAPGLTGGGTPAGGATPTAIAPASWLSSNYASSTLMKYGGQFWVGAGGGGGGAGNASNDSTQGTGGRGAGGLLIEVGGSLNFTTTGGIYASGLAGTAPTNTTYGGAGGGGSGGLVKILYNTLISNAGTITVTGGGGGAGGSNSGASCGAGGGTAYTAGSNGATGSSCTGGAGASGASSVEQNTNYF